MKIRRRFGKTPRQRGSLSGQTCEEVLKTDRGTYVVVGRLLDNTDVAPWLADNGGGIAPYERAVEISEEHFLNAVRQIAAKHDIPEE